jgi:uncharacterized protein (TIGR03435 family)
MRLPLFGAVAIAILATTPLRSQPAYQYEVVSIHRAAPDQNSSGFSEGPQGGMRARNVTAQETLAFAYAVQDYQLAGIPAWGKTERFEISFTPDRSEIVPGRETPRAAFEGWLDRQRQRMKAVLRDRFNLTVHEETRELPTYVLTVAKGGPKLSASAHPERTQSMNINRGRQIVATTAPMKSLAEALGMLLGRPVRDETGLDGAYDFRVDFAPDPTLPLSGPGSGVPPASSEDAGQPSIFTALTEKLGLRLDSRKGPVTVYVIDRIERPSEN